MLTELDLALYLVALASPAIDPRVLAQAVAAVGAGAPTLAEALEVGSDCRPGWGAGA